MNFNYVDNNLKQVKVYFVGDHKEYEKRYKNLF